VIVCPHEITTFPLEGFPWNLIFEYFWKSVQKIQHAYKDVTVYMKHVLQLTWKHRKYTYIRHKF
jgi:hypothetical protein